MLSVLIPVYNFNVTDYVTHIHRLCVNEKIPFEIIVIDDGSRPEFKLENRTIRNLPGVYYSELPENTGWSKIRNRLARLARYEYLLFTDCDSKINDDLFIHRYVEKLSPSSVLFGGRNYAPNPPQNPDYYLHWYYGIKREEIPARKRQEKPWNYFMSNNFVIPKKIYENVRFDEEIISGYGNEDTLFRIQLKNKRIPIIHLDNPLRHVGLEPAETFISKTESAVRNLYAMYNAGMLDDSLKLINIFKILKKSRATYLMGGLYLKNRQKLIRKLKSSKSGLRWLDLYKIGYISALHHGWI